MIADCRLQIGRKRQISRRAVCISICILQSAIWNLLFLPGCSTTPTTQPVTKADPKLATPDYWWNKPAVAAIDYPSFDPLWDACKDELYYRLLPVDREDFRDGLITSVPTVSKQFFEPWRSDAVSTGDVAESTLATIRRTVRFQIDRRDDGTFHMEPRVLVERYAATERRLTAITQYHEAFSGPRTTNDNPDDPNHSGGASPTDYWYAMRRDTDLEKEIAASIRNRLGLPPDDRVPATQTARPRSSPALLFPDTRP